MKKKSTTKHSTHDKAADPVKVPRMADESKGLKEAEVPKADVVGKSEGPCKDCRHAGSLHYGSSDRWCNTSGCQCQAYK